VEPLIVRVEDVENGTTAEHAFVRSPVRIGRSARNDLCLPQRFVSAWHGLIEFDSSAVRYTDLGSTNGTLVNGSAAEVRSPARLEAGAEVFIGSLRFTFPPRKGRALEQWPPPLPAGAPPATGCAMMHTGGEGPLLAAGGITAMMKKLAAAPADDFDRAWHSVLVPGTTIGRFELRAVPQFVAARDAPQIVEPPERSCLVGGTPGGHVRSP